MNRSIEAIPTWALCYIINGDASGLTDEEIRMVDEAMRKNNIEIVSCLLYTSDAADEL